MEPPVDFYERVQNLVKMMPEKIDEYENLLNGNPIWVRRLKGVGYLSAADAVALGVTGPPLRASGLRPAGRLPVRDRARAAAHPAAAGGS